MAKRPPVPDDVFKDICKGMLDAEQSGELSELFKGACGIPGELPARKTLLDSFKPGMKFFRSLFVKIFGYDITTPGFAEDAIARLEILGSTKARDHYRGIVIEWQYYNEKMLRETAAWYKKQDFNKEGVMMSRKQQEAEQRKKALRQMSDRELLILLQKLREENAL